MPTKRETLLCRYHYDPLDRLAACTPSAQASNQRFHLKTRLTTEIQGSAQRSIFQHDDQLLAQQQRQNGTVETTLLATDQQRSVLNALNATPPHSFAYTPYGHRTPEGGLLSLLGFNGERPDPVTGHYVLGNGYRAFNPVLMRFNSPDSWSPFGEGGLNAYAYCVGDPVNREDRTGHISWLALMAKHFPGVLESAKKLKPGTALGFFERLDGAPHITEQILKSLPPKDLGSLASTSKAIKKTVDTVSDRSLTLAIPAQGQLNLEPLTPAIQGEVSGILPYRAVVIHNEIQQNMNNYNSTMWQLAIKESNGTLRRLRHTPKNIRT